MAAERPTAVVDLVALRRACRPLLTNYDRFLAEGTVDLSQVDAALADIRRLPPLGGRLGRALAVLAAGASSCPRDTVAAFELLRSIPALRDIEHRSPRTSGRPGRFRPRVEAPPLPGFE